MVHQLQGDLVEQLAAYSKPVFGFALNRTDNRHDAEDLAQEIMLQLFKSMAAGAGVTNMDAYVWTVARYTWVHFLKKKNETRRAVDLSGIENLLSDPGAGPLEMVLADDVRDRIRREITRLSEMQRRIVVMFYYDGMKQADIAKALGIPVGTVKWHLHDAKKEIEKGMDMVREKGELSYNPVRLTNLGHCGQPGSLGDTSHFLRGSLAQNIVYAAYRKPLSIVEIADELGTPAPFIHDEVKYLAEYGFLSEAGNGKYQANMIIWDATEEQVLESHKLYEECAGKIAGIHFDALMDIRDEIDGSDIYYPDGDYNFLMWALLPKNIREQCEHTGFITDEDFYRATTMRKDGGHYVALARLDKAVSSETGFDTRYYDTCGPMIRYNGGELYLWQLNTYWSERGGWRDLTYTEAELCRAYWNGELPDDEAHREDYAFLISKGYLLRDSSGGYKFNSVWIPSKATARYIGSFLPDLTGEYSRIITKLYEANLTICMRNQPRHIRSQMSYIVKVNVTGGELIAYMLKHLIDNGRLQAPKAEQRKTVTTLMGMIGGC